MAQNKIKWDEMYPDGFLSGFTMRRMPKVLHKRIKRLSVERSLPQEYIVVEALEEGIGMQEVKEYMGEV